MTAIDDFDAAVDANIKQYGWHATGVFPTASDPNDTTSFVYTAGMVEHGYPELIIFGLGATTGHPILQRAVERLREGDLQLGACEGLVQAYPTHLIDVATDHWENYLGVALRRALHIAAENPERINHFHCWQIVWPDKEGRFPWDSDYAITPWVQPVLK